MAGRGNGGLPADELKLKNEIDTLKKKGDKMTDADKKAVSDKTAEANRLKVKRQLTARFAGFQQYAERLRMAAAGTTQAQRDFIKAEVAKHAAAIDSAFSQTEPPKRAAKVEIPD